MNEYYVYTHLNPNTKEVFYVGIGKGNRAWNQWAGRNKFWENYVNKHGFEVELISENLTRKQAEKIEINLIAELGRRQIDNGGTLVNRSSGGEGSIGYTHTAEFKQKLSEDRKGKCTRKERQLSKETKEKISKSLVGREITGAKNIFEVASGYKNQMYKSSGGYIWKYKE